MRLAFAAACALALSLAPVRAEEVRVVSAGAVEGAMRGMAKAFAAASGHTVALSFATATQMRQRFVSGAESTDVLVAPPSVLADLAKAERLAPGARPMLGRVGVGVAVRRGAPKPDISSAEALKAALLAADRVVYNRASTGIYFEGLIGRLGIADAVKAKAALYDTGAAVLEHVGRGAGRELAIAPMTEIRLFVDKGIDGVGPFPAAVQNYTAYQAAIFKDAKAANAAGAFLAYLAGPAARAALDAAGVEPAPQ
jgi:molybdate transport system substrate-binding protein